MIGVVTFWTGETKRGSRCWFVLARHAGCAEPVVFGRSFKCCGVFGGCTVKCFTDWACCVCHVKASSFFSVLSSGAVGNPTQAVDEDAMEGAGWCGGGVGGGGAATESTATLRRN